jgi:hypothetical protein
MPPNDFGLLGAHNRLCVPMFALLGFFLALFLSIQVEEPT